METEQKKPEPKGLNKQMYIIVGVVVVLIIVVAAFFMMRGKKEQSQIQTAQVQPTQEVIPTVDASVKVEVKSESDPKKFDMFIKGIPDKTKSLEYEISYETKEGEIQGFNSEVDIKSGQTTYEKKGFLLGTCSTGGKCTYHTVVGPLKVSIKFVGSYGQRLYENNFEL